MEVNNIVPKVMILRGNSGSGKSTTAVAVVNALRNEKNMKVCYFDMDYFRLTIPGDNINNIESAKIASAMLRASIIEAVEQGYHVVLEGMLSKKSFLPLLEELLIGMAGFW
jgi:predicted ABC-type ATPase